MEGCVQVISREIVKPSSLIHKHPKNLKPSYLDQLSPCIYVPLIFFYQADESKGLTTSNHKQISQHLKHSLSHTLTSFYPLAGRYGSDDIFVVDCNDAGIEFVDARIHLALTDAIKDSTMEELKQFVPIDPTSASYHIETPLVLVQITFFDCGGIALCVCFSHLIGDMKSMSTFINAWADTNRDENSQISQLVTFDLVKYFPRREIPNSSAVRALLSSNEKLITKRFVFHKEVIAHLKRDAILSSRVKDPSRVEVVSAFIWRHIIQVAKSRDPKTKKLFAVVNAVNLRKKKLPTHLLENVFGNCFMNSFATSEELEDDLVSKLRSSIRKIDDEYITKAQSGDNYLNDFFNLHSRFVNGEVEMCIFSSWCRFPLYQVDYGFGKPFWLSTVIVMKNSIRLVDSKCGQNIEAWVNMEHHSLETLENEMNNLMLQSSSHN